MRSKVEVLGSVLWWVCVAQLWPWSPHLFADDCTWRPRAREHFEWFELGDSKQKAMYRGLTNTFNFWCEREGRYGAGLAFNPIIGSVRTADRLRPGLTRELRLYHLGAEWKQYDLAVPGWFVRLGAYASLIDPGGSFAERPGGHALFSLGHERFLPDLGVGIAFELGPRLGVFSTGIRATGVQAALGVHGYAF